MRRNRTDDSQNLDSLLDTMANVVGILVVILAVTQISVGEAMKRIRALEDEAAAEFSRALGRSEEIEDEMRALETELEAFGVANATQRKADLERALATLRAVPAVASVQLSQATLAQNAAAERRRLTALEAEIDERRAQLASLRVSLASLPDAGTAKTVRLPDPRPAPRGTEPAHFFCRYGRVFAVDLEGLKGQLEVALRSAVTRSSWPEIGSEELRWDPFPRLDGARLAWRNRNVGETVFEIDTEGSDYRSALHALNPRKQTVLFTVWPDSFDVYLRARDMAESAGFLAGWDVRSRDQESDWYRVSGAQVLERPVVID